MAHINLYYDSLHESRDWEAYSLSLVLESTVQKTCVCVCEIERDLFWVQKVYVCSVYVRVYAGVYAYFKT